MRRDFIGHMPPKPVVLHCAHQNLKILKPTLTALYRHGLQGTLQQAAAFLCYKAFHDFTKSSGGIQTASTSGLYTPPCSSYFFFSLKQLFAPETETLTSDFPPLPLAALRCAES